MVVKKQNVIFGGIGATICTLWEVVWFPVCWVFRAFRASFGTKKKIHIHGQKEIENLKSSTFKVVWNYTRLDWIFFFRIRTKKAGIFFTVQCKSQFSLIMINILIHYKGLRAYWSKTKSKKFSGGKLIFY